MSLEIAETFGRRIPGVSVGGSVGNWLGLVIEPSGLSFMLRCLKGSTMEVVAEMDSAIGEEEEKKI